MEPKAEKEQWVPGLGRPRPSVLTRLASWLAPYPTLRWRVWQSVQLFVLVSREQGVGVAVRRSVDILCQHASRLVWRKLARLVLPNPRSLEAPELALAPLQPHQSSVDIVVCVHNALADVCACLESVIRYTRPPYRLILVDDGSAEETRRYLAQFADEQTAALIRNEAARGYTLAANQGLQHATADYVILLNSDTLVTPDWLDRMIVCAESDPRIGLVGPLSNTASWQSVPDLLDAEGDWAENRLPETVSAAEMALTVAEYSGRVYPRLGFLNGFCLMLKRQVIEAIGYFDEATFGQGYGEENDYCLRTRRAGWELAVADDAYIFHQQSRSYSHERRHQLSEQANRSLIAKYGQAVISEGVSVCRYDRALEGIRARSRVMKARLQLLTEGRARWEGRRVLFVLPISEPGGGGNVVFQEARAMQRMGVDVRIVNLALHRDVFEMAYPESPLPILYVDRPHHIGELLGEYDAVIATLYASVDWLKAATSDGRLPARGYYIQDFEPFFFSENSREYRLACQSYTRHPDLIRITKTEWNRETVRTQIGVDCTVIGPSVDLDLYRPRRQRDPAWPSGPLRVAAMIRPRTPRRQPRLTMEILRELHRAHGADVDITLFGCGSHDPGFVELPHDFAWRNAGVLKPSQLALLLNECDIFVDFSSFQAMGLTAMEAMACGAAVIVPQNGGASSFARPGENCLAADTASRDACWEALKRLVVDEPLRQRLRRQALWDIVQYFPEQAAYNTLAALLPRK